LKQQTIASSLKKRTEELNSRDLEKSKIIMQPQTIMKKRFHEHFDLLKKEIDSVEDHCKRFGGIEFIRAELDRN
jgi:hypothetical protein